MALNQTERHALGRKGIQAAQKVVKGRKQRFTAPFDLVDFRNGYGYEVKTMFGSGADLKIHISDASMARKVAFAELYGLKMVLVAVVVYSRSKVEIYESDLKQCVRVAQMKSVRR